MPQNKYAEHFLTEPALRNQPKIPMPYPSAYLESARQFGAPASLSMAWRYIDKPMLFDRIPHTHDFDEYLVFLGGDLRDPFDFDATVELSMGEEEEVCPIEQATVVHIPAGFVHTPLTFKRVDKPILFQPVALVSDFYSNHPNRITLMR